MLSISENAVCCFPSTRLCRVLYSPTSAAEQSQAAAIICYNCHNIKERPTNSTLELISPMVLLNRETFLTSVIQPLGQIWSSNYNVAAALDVAATEDVPRATAEINCATTLGVDGCPGILIRYLFTDVHHPQPISPMCCCHCYYNCSGCCCCCRVI